MATFRFAIVFDHECHQERRVGKLKSESFVFLVIFGLFVLSLYLDAEMQVLDQQDIGDTPEFASANVVASLS